MIVRFIMKTIVGGLFFVIPLLLVLVLLREGIQLVSRVVRPVSGLFHAQTYAGFLVADIIAVALILLVCFIAGLVAATGPGRRLSRGIDRLVLRKVPGYTLIKSAAEGMAGLEHIPGCDEATPAVAWIEEAWVPAFVMERPVEGLVTVFVPSAPTPAAGSIYFLPENRVRSIDASMMAELRCVTRLGLGSRELLRSSGLSGDVRGG